MTSGPKSPDNRRTTSAESKSQAETLIRQARQLLDRWNVPMSHNRVVRLVRRYEREVNGFSLVDYFANAVQLDEQRCREARRDSEEVSRLTHADPTAETAVRRVASAAA